MPDRPDIVILMTDEERAIPPYEPADILAWRDTTLKARKWFDDHGVSFQRHIGTRYISGVLDFTRSRDPRIQATPRAQHRSRRPVATDRAASPGRR